MDFTTNDTFRMKVYSPRVGIKVLLKVENSGKAAISFQKEVLTTVANAWKTLTFDYSTISKIDSFGKLVANFTFYTDDIVLLSSATASIKGNTFANVNFYPNPTTYFLKISSDKTIQKASIYNILGKIVKTIYVNEKSKSIGFLN
ncbi:MAG: T9SS type A sorting domain-containing protein [Polaribacter sp.]|uniref:T9SS type A sorting domain-containing protein n=1 Tax=Polaribacter sp. TaxID=1920175 RepID=UPI002F34F345